MALDIVLFNGDYRIISDVNNIIVQKRVFVDPKKSPSWKEGDSTDVREEYRDLTYHPTIDRALKSLAEQKVRNSDAKTLEEVRREIAHIYREISVNYSVRD